MTVRLFEGLARFDLHPGMVLPFAWKWTLPATEVVTLMLLALLKIRFTEAKVMLAVVKPWLMVMVVLVVVMEL